MKSPNDSIGNGNRNLPGGSAVPQPAAPPVPQSRVGSYAHFTITATKKLIKISDTKVTLLRKLPTTLALCSYRNRRQVMTETFMRHLHDSYDPPTSYKNVPNVKHVLTWTRKELKHLKAIH